MSHFYGWIQGQAGDATRQGSERSGIDGYVQGWQSRLSVSMDRRMDKDAGMFRIGTGPSNYSGGTLTLAFPDVDSVVNALAANDPRIEAICKRLRIEIDKLNDEAPKAVKRAKNKAAKEERRQKREEKARKLMQDAVMRDMLSEEKARVVRLLRLVELDEQGNFLSSSRWYLCGETEGNLRVGEDGHVYISAPTGSADTWARFPFDVTAGQWVFLMDPDEFMVNEGDRQGFGYRVEQEPKVAT